LTEILNGELDGLLEALSTTEQAQQLEAILS